MWRVVKEGMATLQEIEAHWSVEDVLNANVVLDAWHEAATSEG